MYVRMYTVRRYIQLYICTYVHSANFCNSLELMGCIHVCTTYVVEFILMYVHPDIQMYIRM